MRHHVPRPLEKWVPCTCVRTTFTQLALEFSTVSTATVSSSSSFHEFNTLTLKNLLLQGLSPFLCSLYLYCFPYWFQICCVTILFPSPSQSCMLLLCLPLFFFALFDKPHLINLYSYSSAVLPSSLIALNLLQFVNLCLKCGLQTCRPTQHSRCGLTSDLYSPCITFYVAYRPLDHFQYSIRHFLPLPYTSWLLCTACMITPVWFVPKRVGVEYVNTCMQELFVML